MRRQFLLRFSLLGIAFALMAAPPSQAQSEAFAFHGLRMGMRVEQIEAAGFRLRYGADTSISSAGWEVTAGLPPGLQALTVYLYNHELFQLDAAYAPVRGQAALEAILALRKGFHAPEDGAAGRGRFDPLRDDKWSWGGLTFHYSPGIRDDGSLSPSLLITDEAVYQHALEMKRNPPRNLVY